MKITIEIDIVWDIKNIEGYAFGTDKKLYNLKRGVAKKQCCNNGSIGYWINRQFYTLKALKPLLYKKTKTFCPF